MKTGISMRLFGLVTGLAIAAWAVPGSKLAAQAETKTETIVCSSDRYEEKRCTMPGRILDVQPISQTGSVGCRQGQNWGYQRKTVWVAQGCSAVFEVTYRLRNRDSGSDVNSGNAVVDDPVPAPSPSVTVGAMPSGIAAERALIAQAACIGVFGALPRKQTANDKSYVFTVPRNCKRDSALSCEQICSTASVSGNVGQYVEPLQRQCINSIHVYKQTEVMADKLSGNVTQVYANCEKTQCGPNYCCCMAQ